MVYATLYFLGMNEKEFTLLEYPIAVDGSYLVISNGDKGFIEETLKVKRPVYFWSNYSAEPKLNLFNSLKEEGELVFRFMAEKDMWFKPKLNASLIINFEMKLLELIKLHGNSWVFLVLKDSATVDDVAGTGEDREVLYSQIVQFEGKLKIRKYKFISWKKVPIKHPFVSVLYYGKIINFKDRLELTEFQNEFFTERLEDLCPVCGNPKGKHLRYGFFEVGRIPQHYYVCSKECLREFAKNRFVYYKLLKDQKKS